MPTRLSILGIGNFACQEFSNVGSWLTNVGGSHTSDIRSAIAFIQNDSPRALIVVAQRWPGEYSNSDVEQLRVASPIARIVGLLGPWMEGETRTGKPMRAVPRFYWHQWPRLVRQIELLRSGEPSPLFLPLTSGEDERLFAPPVRDRSDDAAKQIAIFADHRETAKSLADLCSMRGWSTVWLRSVPPESMPGIDAVIMDTPRAASEAFTVVAAIRKVVARAPILAIAGFPRRDDVNALHDAGATAVISKPYLADDLLCQIEQLASLPAV